MTGVPAAWAPPPTTLSTAIDAVTSGLNMQSAGISSASSAASSALTGMNIAMASLSLPKFETLTVKEFPMNPVEVGQGPQAPALPGTSASYSLNSSTVAFPSLGALVDVSPDFGSAPPEANIVANFPGSPGVGDVGVNFPDAPGGANLGSVTGLTIGDVPTLSAVAPSISTITPPIKFSGTAPVMGPIAERLYPDKPGYTMPTMSELRDLVIPTAPTMLSIAFEGTLPETMQAPPDVSFNFVETTFSSALCTAAENKLLELIQNLRTTGLSEAVQAQLWAVRRERITSASTGAINDITRISARNGWDVAQGDEIEAIYAAIESATAEAMAESRDIANTQANLEQQNYQFAIQQTLGHINNWMILHNNVQQRAFETAKYAVQAVIDLYGIYATYYNSSVALYQAQAVVFEKKMQAELTKVELFKALLDGQRLISDLNSQEIEQYKAQIEAVSTIFDLYKAELEGVKTQIEGDGLKVQMFEAAVRAFAEEINAKKLEYDGYTAELGGEEIKAKIFSAIVDAYGAEVNAFAAKTDAAIKKQDADIKIAYEVPLDILDKETKVFEVQVKAEAARLEATTSVQELKIKLFQAIAEVEAANLKAQTDVYSTNVEAYKAKIEGEAAKLEALNGINKNITEIYKAGIEGASEQQKAITENNKVVADIYGVEIQALIAQLNAVVNMYGTEGQVFGSIEQAKGAVASANAQIASANAQISVENTKALIASTEAQINAMLAEKEIAVKAQEGAARIGAQMVAAFAGAVSVGAHVAANSGDSTSNSASNTFSNSVSDSTYRQG